MTDILSKETSNVLQAKEENLLVWNEILEKFKKTFGNDIYESWIKKLRQEKSLELLTKSTIQKKNKLVN